MRDLLLTPHQEAVAHTFLAEVSARRRHLVVALSGAHAYGFPSPDSDLDLKAIHIAPTRALLGFGRAGSTSDRLEIREGVEVDYSSNELRDVLHGALKGNGNYIERVLSGFYLQADPLLEELKPLVAAALCRKVHGHYFGFASQLARRLDQPGATVKHLLYVLRCALTGAHMLRTGSCETDLSVLATPHGFPEAHDLIAAKRAGERTPLEASALDAARSLAARALAALDAAVEGSVLPMEADGAALEDWLVRTRVGALAGDQAWAAMG